LLNKRKVQPAINIFFINFILTKAKKAIHDGKLTHLSLRLIKVNTIVNAGNE